MRAWVEAPAQAALEPAGAALPLRPEQRGEARAAGQFVARTFKLNLRPALGAWF